MKTYVYTNLEQIDEILKRPSVNTLKIEKVVRPILEKIQRGGDKALKKFALEYDQVELTSLWVTEEELNNAGKGVSEELKAAIQMAYENIERFHKAQRRKPLDMEVMPGVICRRRSVPIRKVGLYVPGGTAPLFSTVLMLGVPAVLAGCEEIILTSPTNKLGEINPVVLYTANLLGIKRVLKLGGAQAIGALAFGSESVPKVDKIFGPGNQYVTMAKLLVANHQVAIDMPAGPSEVLVLVDDHARAKFAAADLLSQAEHGADSQVVLVTTSKQMAEKVLAHVEKQVEKLPRKDIAKLALKNSTAIIVGTMAEALDIINEYGPEHLIINVRDAEKYLDDIRNAGSVFIGPYTPESAGDYASGTNHTLPTNGWARSYSGVSLDSFTKEITYQEISEKGILKLGPTVEVMAQAEGLDGHKNAVSVRLKSLIK